jgi:hypothetical protein
MKHVNGFIEKVELTPNIWLMVMKSTFNLFPAELLAMTADGELIASITVLDDKIKDAHTDKSPVWTIGHYWTTSKDIKGGALYSLGSALHVFMVVVMNHMQKEGAPETSDIVFGSVMELVKLWIESDERTGVEKNSNSSK